MIFDPYTATNITDKHGAFSALFLTQQSYINLLELVDIYFKLGIRNPDSTLPCLSQTYLYITSDSSKLSRGVGKSGNLKVSHLGYEKKTGALIALVKLKHNFTDAKYPHIVISKPTNMTRTDVRVRVPKEFNLVQLHAEYTVYGKIGIMTGSKEEQSRPTPTSIQTVDDEGRDIQIATRTVDRPELTLSVDNSHSPSGDVSNNEIETFNGLIVHKGIRGGKYVILPDGKRRYLTDEAIAQSKKRNRNVIYNINFLSDNTAK